MRKRKHPILDKGIFKTSFFTDETIMADFQKLKSIKMIMISTRSMIDCNMNHFFRLANIQNRLEITASPLLFRQPHEDGGVRIDGEWDGLEAVISSRFTSWGMQLP